jgi:hypothetical protein
MQQKSAQSLCVLLSCWNARVLPNWNGPAEIVPDAPFFRFPVFPPEGDYTTGKLLHISPSCPSLDGRSLVQSEMIRYRGRRHAFKSYVQTEVPHLLDLQRGGRTRNCEDR